MEVGIPDKGFNIHFLLYVFILENDLVGADKRGAIVRHTTVAISNFDKNVNAVFRQDLHVIYTIGSNTVDIKVNTFFGVIEPDVIYHYSFFTRVVNF